MKNKLKIDTKSYIHTVSQPIAFSTAICVRFLEDNFLGKGLLIPLYEKAMHYETIENESKFENSEIL